MLQRDLRDVVCEPQKDSVHIRVGTGVAANFVHKIPAEYLERREIDLRGLAQQDLGHLPVEAAAQAFP